MQAETVDVGRERETGHGAAEPARASPEPAGAVNARDGAPRGGLLTSGPPLYYLRALTGPTLAVARRLVALGFLVPAER